METISKFFTDTPTMISFLMLAGTIAIPAKLAGFLENKVSPGMAKLVPVEFFCVLLVVQYFTYKYVGYPAWMGWIVRWFGL